MTLLGGAHVGVPGIAGPAGNPSQGTAFHPRGESAVTARREGRGHRPGIAPSGRASFCRSGTPPDGGRGRGARASTGGVRPGRRRRSAVDGGADRRRRSSRRRRASSRRGGRRRGAGGRTVRHGRRVRGAPRKELGCSGSSTALAPLAAHRPVGEPCRSRVVVAGGAPAAGRDTRHSRPGCCVTTPGSGTGPEDELGCRTRLGVRHPMRRTGIPLVPRASDATWRGLAGTGRRRRSAAPRWRPRTRSCPHCPCGPGRAERAGSRAASPEE